MSTRCSRSRPRDTIRAACERGRGSARAPKLAPTPARLACWRRALTDVRGRRRARNARARWEMNARLAGLDAATDEVERTLAHLVQEDNAQADEFLRVQARTKTSPRGWFRLVQKDRLQRALALACQRGDVVAIEAAPRTALRRDGARAPLRALRRRRLGGHAARARGRRRPRCRGARCSRTARRSTRRAATARAPLMLAAQQGHRAQPPARVARRRRGAALGRPAASRRARVGARPPGGEESEYDGPPAARGGRGVPAAAPRARRGTKSEAGCGAAGAGGRRKRGHVPVRSQRASHPPQV